MFTAPLSWGDGCAKYAYRSTDQQVDSDSYDWKWSSETDYRGRAIVTMEVYNGTSNPFSDFIFTFTRSGNAYEVRQIVEPRTNGRITLVVNGNDLEGETLKARLKVFKATTYCKETKAQQRREEERMHWYHLCSKYEAGEGKSDGTIRRGCYEAAKDPSWIQKLKWENL
jgi:acylphosphatase